MNKISLISKLSIIKGIKFLHNCQAMNISFRRIMEALPIVSGILKIVMSLRIIPNMQHILTPCKLEEQIFLLYCLAVARNHTQLTKPSPHHMQLR